MRDSLRNICWLFVLVIVVMPLWSAFPGCANAQGKKQNDFNVKPSFTSFRDIPGVTAEEIAAVEALQKRRRTFTYAMPLSSEAFVHDKGKISGFSALFCAWLSEIFGIRFTPEIRPLSQIHAGLQSGRVDFTGALSPTEEHRSRYFMTDPIAERALKYFRLEGSTPLAEIQRVRPIRYGLLRGSSVAARVIETHEPDTYEVVPVENYSTVHELLKSERIDAFIHEEPAEAVFDAYGNVLAQNYFPVVLSPVSLTAKNPELEVIISIMQKALQHGGKAHLNALYNQGYQEYRRHKFFSKLSKDEKNWLRNHKVVPFLAEHYNYPLSFYNKHEKEWQGIVFDVLREVEMFTGLTFERINDESMDWSVLLPMLESGQAVMLTELLRTEDRKNRFLWLETPLLNNPYILISSLDRPSVRPSEVYSLKIGVAQNTAYVEFFHKWYPNHPLVTEYPSESAAFDALHRGEVDMVMSSTSRLLALINHYEVTGFKANVTFDWPSFSTMGLNKDQAVLASIIDKALSQVEVSWISGQWATMSLDYQGMHAQKQRLWLIGVSVLLSCVIALLFVLFQRKRQEGKRLDELVRRRTAALEAVQHDLERAVESEKQASQYKSAFLARMSHEIRTPMNAILGMAELALRGDITASVQRQVFAIQHAGNNLLSIINDILDFSKIESGHMEIVPGNYQLASLIDDVVSIIRTKKKDSPVQFVVYTDSKIPNALYGDEVRVRQILLNLLSNAVRYTKKGYISLRINGEITENDFVNLAIEVTDSGIGIKPEDMDKLFMDFVQLDTRSSRSTEGTGLGLAITRSLVKAMNGDISVTSEYGRGSTFFITLPQKIRSHEKMATVENPDEKPVLVYEPNDVYANSILYAIANLGVACTLVTSEGDFRGEISAGAYSFVFTASDAFESVREICRQAETKAVIVTLIEFGKPIAEQTLNILTLPAHAVSIANILNGKAHRFSHAVEDKAVASFIAPGAEILVVDDIDTNLEVAYGLLSPYRMQITLCRSGKEAIEAIAAKPYCMILMDHMMPEMDGIETTRRIRELDNAYSKNIPVIALTANAISGAREHFLASGFDDFLSKPISTLHLNTILEKWIPREKQQKYLSENVADSAASGDMPAIAGIDIKKGIAMSGGETGNYRRTLGIFARDGEKKTGDIQRALDADNLHLYTTYVHALKSAAANVGAAELSEMAKALETAGKLEDRMFIYTHNERLLLTLDTLVKNIRSALESETKDLLKSHMNTDQISAWFISLAKALDNADLRAIRAATRNIEAFSQTTGIGEDVSSILQNILVGEYDEAVSTIKTVLEKLERN